LNLLSGELANMVQRYVDGDNEALADLYLHISKRLLLLAYSKCHDQELSRDVVHDVFERMLQLPVAKRRAYFGDMQGNIEAYLYVAVKNKCADAVKVATNRENILNSIRSLFTDRTTNQSLEKFSRDGLMEMLNNLQPKEQQIIRLHLDGYSNEEIAASLQITYSTVKNNIYEAKKKLRRLWRLFMT
jgi:RNA polymerase sigma factor (sigma-70 family)